MKKNFNLKNLLQYRYNHDMDLLKKWIKFKRFTDEQEINLSYHHIFGEYPNLLNPKRLNEKIQWLKLNDRDPSYSMYADKYAVRQFIKTNFGEEFLIPLLYETTNYRTITMDTIPDVPCIIKANHDSGHYMIVRDKNTIDIKKLREDCRYWLHLNHYEVSREWQYNNIKPRRIIIEKLLQTKEGKLPNDYKFHYINGELQFIYVSYDREGINDRCMYDENWNHLPFIWIPKNSWTSKKNTTEVPRPESLDMMKEFGSKVAKLFKYVRVDFYDVDGKLYFGEITLHHGSGFDRFFPDEYDFVYGEKLSLK